MNYALKAKEMVLGRRDGILLCVNTVHEDVNEYSRLKKYFKKAQ